MKRIVRWRVAGLAAFALLVVAAVGAGTGHTARILGADRTSATTLIDGTTDTVTNIDPAGNYDFGTFTLDNLVFEHLIELKPGGKLTPGLATNCSSNEQLTVWTCTLRKGVKFHNGDDFTSTDVKFSFDRVQKIKDPSGIYSLLGNLKSTEAQGPSKVVFNLAEPQSTWPLILTTGAGFIVDHT